MHINFLKLDVACFLAWASEPEHDDRKKWGVQWITGNLPPPPSYTHHLGIISAVTFHRSHQSYIIFHTTPS